MRNSILPFDDVTVYNLSINSNYRILAVELNYRFTHVITETLPY